MFLSMSFAMYRFFYYICSVKLKREMQKLCYFCE